MQVEMKRGSQDKPRVGDGKAKPSGAKKLQAQVPGGVKPSPPPKKPTSPPRDGCLICKGQHWVRDCPSSSEEQKRDALVLMKNNKKGSFERAKAAKGPVHGGSVRRACINGVLEVPFCPDTGADSNIVSRALVEELKGVGAAADEIKLEPSVPIQVAGGQVIHCQEAVNWICASKQLQGQCIWLAYAVW